MFYVTLYTSKNNQKEEKRSYLNAATAVSRRIHRQAVTHDSFDDSPADFAEGLSQLLSGIRAHMSSSIISPPLAHLLVCQDSRFKFSHDFAYLLVSQIEDHLEEKDTNFKLRYCKDKNSKKTYWSDSTVNDIVYHPECLTIVGAYESLMHYKQGYYNG